MASEAVLAREGMKKSFIKGIKKSFSAYPKIPQVAQRKSKHCFNA
jgi:hypothetical protein